MTKLAMSSVHARWQDWLFVGLGLAIVLSPLAAARMAPGALLTNILAIGLIVLCVTLFEFERRIRIEELAQFLGGLWLAASTFLPDFAALPRLSWIEFVLGLSVALLAAYELWQDAPRRA